MHMRRPKPSLPEPQRLEEDVWALASPIPDSGPPFTLTYVLRGEDGAVRIVDPGWGGDENVAHLRGGLRRIGVELEDVAEVIATHHHPDHLGIADAIRTISGARVLLSAEEREVLRHQLRPDRRDPGRYAERLAGWGVPAAERPALIAVMAAPSDLVEVEPDGLVGDGDVLDWSGHRLRVLATPGHTDGHICLVDAERGAIYTGDHVLPRITSGLGLGTRGERDPLSDVLDSLEALSPFDAYRVLPGHEHPFSGLASRRHSIARHHLARTEEVVGLRAALGDAPVWEYAVRIRWSAGWDALTGFFRHSALEQTERHLRLVAAGKADEMLGR